MAENVRSCLEEHRARSVLADITEKAKSQSTAHSKTSIRDQMRLARAKMAAANKNKSEQSEDSCLVVIA